MRRHPDLTVVIPHRPQEKVGPVLNRLKRRLPAGLRCQVVCVSGNQPSVQRNLAVRRARSEIVYFMDNDSFVSAGSIELAMEIFRKEPETAIVGGPSMTPRSNGFLQQCFGLTLSSLFAVGPSIRSRYAPVGGLRYTGEFELILCNMFIRTRIFRKFGGFDERLYPNEENAFINTVLKRGYKARYHPAISVERGQRSGLVNFIKQMLTYGRGRAEQFIVQPSSFNLFLLAPVVFTLYMTTLIAGFGFLQTGTLRLAAAAPFLVYTCLDLLFGIAAGIGGRKIAAIPVTAFLFVLVHFFYGLGLITGTVGMILRKKGNKPVSARIDHESYL